MVAVLDSVRALSAPVKQKVHWTDRLGHLVLMAIAVALLAFLAAPLTAILAQSVESRDGSFVGLDNLSPTFKRPR